MRAFFIFKLQVANVGLNVDQLGQTFLFSHNNITRKQNYRNNLKSHKEIRRHLVGRSSVISRPKPSLKASPFASDDEGDDDPEALGLALWDVLLQKNSEAKKEDFWTEEGGWDRERLREANMDVKSLNVKNI